MTMIRWTALATVAAAILGEAFLGAAESGDPGSQRWPADLLPRMRSDIAGIIRRDAAESDGEAASDADIDRIIRNGFGGQLANFDADDTDEEVHICLRVSDGKTTRNLSLIYDRQSSGWILAGILEGHFPVGSAKNGSDGWRDITTQEPLSGTDFLMRTYRFRNGRYIKMSEFAEGGG